MKPETSRPATPSPSFRGRSAVLRIFPLMLVSALLNDSSRAHATVYCQDINGKRTVVGEARFDISPGAGCYANIYWDGGDELSLGPGPLGGSPIIGGASTAATNLGFYVQTNTRDPFPDACAEVTYELVQKRSNSISGNCPSGYTAHTDTFVVNACEFGVDDYYYVDTRFGRDSLPSRSFWQWDLSVTASGDGNCTATDSGCAQVSTTCTRSDYL